MEVVQDPRSTEVAVLVVCIVVQIRDRGMTCMHQVDQVRACLHNGVDQLVDLAPMLCATVDA